MGKKVGTRCHFGISDSIELSGVEITRVDCICVLYVCS